MNSSTWFCVTNYLLLRSDAQKVQIVAGGERYDYLGLTETSGGREFYMLSDNKVWSFEMTHDADRI